MFFTIDGTRLEHVRTLSPINTIPFNLETFLLIEKGFPNVRTIQFREKDVYLLQESKRMKGKER